MLLNFGITQRTSDFSIRFSEQGISGLRSSSCFWLVARSKNKLNGIRKRMMAMRRGFFMSILM